MDLWDFLPPASRASDPPTSARAAAEITGDGSRARAMRRALELVRQYPGRTAGELDALNGSTDGSIRKRLNDLRELGLVRTGPERVSAVSGKLCQTWYPIERG